MNMYSIVSDFTPTLEPMRWDMLFTAKKLFEARKRA
jgi:hypothetical protein